MRDAAGRAAGRRADIAALVGGLAILAVGMLIVADGDVPGLEESTFHAVNDLPGWLYPVVWPFQQLGALVLGPIVAVVALLMRKYRLAIAALLVTVLKLVSERAVKAAVSRQRPGTSIGSDVELRGDVHAAGESFVSGHAVLVTALAGVVTPYLPGRWKIVPWVLVAVVMIGRVYVGAHNPLDVICGAALGLAIAGAVNLATGVGRRRPAEAGPGEVPAPAPSPDRPIGTARRRLVAVLGAVLVVAPTSCTGDDAGTAAPSVLGDDAITVGSFDFTESIVVAEIYSQGLEAAGFEVRRAFGLGPREFVGPALVAGLVELVPEYAGTAAEFHSLGTAEPSEDVATTQIELAEALEGRDIVALAPAPAQDANTFVVTQETADRLDLSSLSDLRAVARELALGGPTECPNRPHCLLGLKAVYRLRFDEFVALEADVTLQALQGGAVDVALMFTTDPLIVTMGLVELADDRGLQPAENITPLIRSELVARWGDALVSVIDSVSARLTTATVRNLNRVAGQPGADIGSIAAAWWAEETS